MVEAAEPPVQVVSIDALEYQVAIKYGLNEQRLKKVVSCESGDIVDVVGDGGESFGLAQIHLPDHLEISKEQAVDPAFALDWMGKMWATGHASAWSCYRKLYSTP